VKSVTIQINDLFEFEGQPVPAQRPDPAVIEAMARRQFEFFRQPLQIGIGDHSVTVSFAAEASAAQDEAVRLAKRVANPEVPNPYYGLGVTFHCTGKPDLAARALDRLSVSARAQDARSKTVFDQARMLYVTVQDNLVKQQHPEAFKAVENFRAGLEQLSGYPVRVTEGEFRDKTSAIIQMAWKHGRDHHLIKCRTGLPEDLLTHQLAHELTHLQLEAEARKAGKNRFFVTTAQTEQTVLQRLEGDLRKPQRKGFSAEAAQNLVTALIRGLAGFLFNRPLDMLIETRLRERMPALSAGQFAALRMGAQEALGTFMALLTVLSLYWSALQFHLDNYTMALIGSEPLTGGRFLFPALMAWLVAGAILLLRTSAHGLIDTNEPEHAGQSDQPTARQMT
jgi:hypothetical protein